MARKTEKGSIEKDFWTKTMGLECYPLPSGKTPYASLDVMKEIIKLKEGAPKKATKVKKPETDEEISQRILKAFSTIGRITQGTIDGAFRATIISGPPGLGKSYTVDEAIRKYDPNGVNTKKITAVLSAAGLYTELWDHREEGQILILDDCDSVFDDVKSLNLLKAACDTQKTGTRTLNWGTKSQLFSNRDGGPVENRFDFNGTIIFITNIDFDDMIEEGHRHAPHYDAFRDRATYISLGMKTRKEYMMRVEQIADSLFKDENATCRKEVLGFMWKNIDSFKSINARLVSKLIGYRQTMPTDWKEIAAQSEFKKSHR
jgi:hypothetical protein